jgi:hypothetical protein
MSSRIRSRPWSMAEKRTIGSLDSESNLALLSLNPFVGQHESSEEPFRSRTGRRQYEVLGWGSIFCATFSLTIMSDFKSR